MGDGQQRWHIHRRQVGVSQLRSCRAYAVTCLSPIKPMTPYNPDFDIDLQFGEKYEDCLADLLNRAKVEVKTERDLWVDTGNIAVEIRCNGKPSGLSVTKAEYWAHIMTKDGVIKFIAIIPVDTLKRRVKYLLENNRARIIMGGDNSASEIILMPLSEIIGNK